MAEYEEKFIVINKKHLDKVPNRQAVQEFLYGLKKIHPWLSVNEYFVCNQDEPYADEVLKIILDGETKKELLNAKTQKSETE